MKKRRVDFYLNNENEIEDLGLLLLNLFFGDLAPDAINIKNFHIGDGINSNGGRCYIRLMMFEFAIEYTDPDLGDNINDKIYKYQGGIRFLQQTFTMSQIEGVTHYIIELLKSRGILLEEVQIKEFELLKK